MKVRIGWQAIARYLAGESPAEETAAVETWIAADPKHADVLATARRAWNAAASDTTGFDTDRAWRSLSARIAGFEGGAPAVPMHTHSRWRRMWWVPTLAAAVIAFVLLLPVVRGRFETPRKVFATGPSHVTTVHLDDGSVVRLAPNTELKVAVNGKREAWLKGRGFFAIAKRNGEPFVVHTAAGDARVLGTRFELTSAGRDVRLVVFEGRVALTAKGASEVVEAGQISSAVDGRAPVAPKAADVKQLTPWMDGVLIFQATPLSAVAAELKREYGVRVVLADDALASRTVSAVFEQKPLETVVAAVCRVADVTCDTQGTTVVIRP